MKRTMNCLYDRWSRNKLNILVLYWTNASLFVLEGCISQYTRLLYWRDASHNTLDYCTGGMHLFIHTAKQHKLTGATATVSTLATVVGQPNTPAQHTTLKHTKLHQTTLHLTNIRRKRRFHPWFALLSLQTLNQCLTIKPIRLTNRQTCKQTNKQTISSPHMYAPAPRCINMSKS